MKICYDIDELSIEQKKQLLELIKSNLTSKEAGQSKIFNDKNDDSSPIELATPAQVKYLRGLKYDGDPRKLTKVEASAKIKELGGK